MGKYNLKNLLQYFIDKKKQKQYYELDAHYYTARFINITISNPHNNLGNKYTHFSQDDIEALRW